MKKLIATLTSILIVTTFFLGCVGQDDEKITEIRIGYQPSTHQVAHMIAMEKGWWQDNLKEYGIERVREFEFPSGPPEMQAMLAGQIDIAYVGATPPITAIDQGLDAKIVAAAQGQGSALVIQPDADYTGPSYLVGKSVGTFPPGSIQDMVLKKWLKDNGVDITKVDIKAMGPGDATTALTARQLDAVFLPDPAPAILEVNGNGKIVALSGEMWPNHVCCVVLVRGDLIRDHPELVKEIIRIHIKATEFINENPEETAEIASRKLGIDKDTVIYSMENSDILYYHDPNIALPVMEGYANEHYSLGYIRRPLTGEDLVDVTLYNEIMSE